jgi:hypothetical protein
VFINGFERNAAGRIVSFELPSLSQSIHLDCDSGEIEVSERLSAEI